MHDRVAHPADPATLLPLGISPADVTGEAQGGRLEQGRALTRPSPYCTVHQRGLLGRDV